MQISNKTYDILKWVAQYLLPASGTLYFALSTIWGLPYGEQVVGTITAIDTFLGIILGINTAAYKKSDQYGDGTLNVDTSYPDTDRYRLDFSTPLNEVEKKPEVVLKVVNKSAEI